MILQFDTVSSVFPDFEITKFINFIFLFDNFIFGFRLFIK